MPSPTTLTVSVCFGLETGVTEGLLASVWVGGLVGDKTLVCDGVLASAFLLVGVLQGVFVAVLVVLIFAIEVFIDNEVGVGVRLNSFPNRAKTVLV